MEGSSFVFLFGLTFSSGYLKINISNAMKIECELPTT